MVIIKQDDMQFVLPKGNAFLLKGRIIIILEYQSWKPAFLLRPPKTPDIISHNTGISEAPSSCFNQGFPVGWEYLIVMRELAPCVPHR
jgi:hypothetical protein